MATAIVEVAPLTTQDRCDRCNAQAQVRTFLRTGSSLLFCGHHYVAHESVLATLVDHVQDNRSK